MAVHPRTSSAAGPGVRWSEPIQQQESQTAPQPCDSVLGPLRLAHRSRVAGLLVPAARWVRGGRAPRTGCRQPFPCGALFRDAPLDCLRLRYPVPLGSAEGRAKVSRTITPSLVSTLRTDRGMHDLHRGEVHQRSGHIDTYCSRCSGKGPQRPWGPKAVGIQFPDSGHSPTLAAGQFSFPLTPKSNSRISVTRTDTQQRAGEQPSLFEKKTNIAPGWVVPGGSGTETWSCGADRGG